MDAASEKTEKLIPDFSFRQRIRRRNVCWHQQAFEGIHAPNTCKTETLDRNHDKQDWRCCLFWQRKLSNKLNAHEFACKHDIKTARRYWSGRDLSTLNLAELPTQYVIKPSFGSCSNNVFLIKDGIDLFQQCEISNPALMASLDKIVEVDPRVHLIVEQFVRDEAGKYRIPTEYQFYMFAGNIELICVIHRRAPNHLTQDRFYTPDWEPTADLIRAIYPDKAEITAPPRCFEEMKDQARRLGTAYDSFVRLDFFATDEGPVFCEFTATPNMGRGYTPIGDNILAAAWQRHFTDKI